jgi:hypothetical protein
MLPKADAALPEKYTKKYKMRRKVPVFRRTARKQAHKQTVLCEMLLPTEINFRERAGGTKPENAQRHSFRG